MRRIWSPFIPIYLAFLASMMLTVYPARLHAQDAAPEFDPSVKEYHYYVDDLNFAIPTRMVTIVYHSGLAYAQRVPASACPTQQDKKELFHALPGGLTNLSEFTYVPDLDAWHIKLSHDYFPVIGVRWGTLSETPTLNRETAISHKVHMITKEAWWFCRSAAFLD